MVTGSHIPADRNGLKFYRADGEIDKGDEAAILAHLDARPGNPIANLSQSISDEATNRYLARYSKLRPGVSLEGLRIGVYQHSSVARDSLPEVLEHLGADVVPLGRASGFVPVDTEALRDEDIALLKEWSAAHGFDAIVSTDGDADRPLIADERGMFLRGDLVGLITSKFLGATTVVTPVTLTSAVELSESFQQVVRTKVGSPYVIAGMASQSGIVVGFEANGGVLLGSRVSIGGVELSALPTRDAFLPIVGVLALARRNGVPLSVLAQSFPSRRTVSGLLRETPAEVSAPLLARLANDDAYAAAALAPIGRISSKLTIDGVKFVLQNGDSVHFRGSGNAPELRCYAEAATEERAQALVAQSLFFARNAIQRELP
jgi:phosphomannomutase